MEKLRKKPRRKGKQRATLPTRFEPRILSEADGRFQLVKELRRRFRELKDHTGCDSLQREILCERAVFITAQLETAETLFAQGQPIEIGTYTQQINTLLGLLKALGLERRMASTVLDLKSYVEAKK